MSTMHVEGSRPWAEARPRWGVRGLAAMLKAARAARADRRAGEALARLDAHLLRDIGVSREDAVRFALCGRP